MFDPTDVLFSDYKDCVIVFGAENGLDLGAVDSKKLQWCIESKIKSELRHLSKDHPM